MQQITDEYMKEMLPKAKAYSVVILKPTPKIKELGAKKIIWEHGRRNFALRAEGIMPIVCPVPHYDAVAGVGIFTKSPEETKVIMEEDPGVKSGPVFVFRYLDVGVSRGYVANPAIRY